LQVLNIVTDIQYPGIRLQLGRIECIVCQASWPYIKSVLEKIWIEPARRLTKGITPMISILVPFGKRVICSTMEVRIIGFGGIHQLFDKVTIRVQVYTASMRGILGVE